MKSVSTTSKAPVAIGPYSQAVLYESLVFCSGQIPLDPHTGEITDGGISEQTHQVMKNLGEVLNASGSHWDKVLKCSIFLIDMNDFPIVNTVYAEYFKTDPPARETVAVKELPAKARVEISCIAHL